MVLWVVEVEARVRADAKPVWGRERRKTMAMPSPPVLCDRRSIRDSVSGKAVSVHEDGERRRIRVRRLGMSSDISLERKGISRSCVLSKFSAKSEMRSCWNFRRLGRTTEV